MEELLRRLAIFESALREIAALDGGCTLADAQIIAQQIIKDNSVDI